MYFAVIDCGTTNTRIYIVNEDGRVIAKARKKVGVRDASITENKEILKYGIKSTFEEALMNANLTIQEIKFGVSFGGITSEIGLIDLPHIEAPSTLKDVANGITRIHDPSVVPVDIPVYFIRGIKNKRHSGSPELMQIGTLDFMRGEETQVAGLLSSYNLHSSLTLVFLSSHSKFISIAEHMKILGGVTTLSGQLYEALVQHTFIGKSVKERDDFDYEHYFDCAVIDSAKDWVQRFGFLRSLIIPRILDILVGAKWWERKLFLEACIAAEDIDALNQFPAMQFPTDTGYVLIGKRRRSRIYEYLLRSVIRVEKDILFISDEDEIDLLGVKGAFYLARLRKLLGN